MSVIKLGCTNLEFLNICQVRYLLMSRGCYSPPTPATTRGVVTHKLLEYSVRNDLKTLEEELRKYEGDKNYKFYISLLKEFENWKPKLKQIHHIERKQKVIIELDGRMVQLSGRPDLVADIEFDSGVYTTVVDYKTSTSDNSQAIYTYQPLWYALIFSYTTGKDVQKVCILNFKGVANAKMVPYERDITQQDYLWLIKFIDYAIATEERGVFQKSWVSCNWCDYKPHCKKLPHVVVLNEHTDLVRTVIQESWQEASENTSK